MTVSQLRLRSEFAANAPAYAVWPTAVAEELIRWRRARAPSQVVARRLLVSCLTTAEMRLSGPNSWRVRSGQRENALHTQGRALQRRKSQASKARSDGANPSLPRQQRSALPER